MNARQKAKYYKKRCEVLEKRLDIYTSRDIVTPVNVEVLKVCEIIPRYMEYDETFLDITKRRMAEKMADFLKDFVDYRVEEDFLSLGRKVEARLSVVRR